ncbi:MAG: peptidyl-prolyl cis-trans isomerase [Acidobacteriota bacterium]|nr:peptidyl-prolyl cis-trans isomerase [Acidobacteriota bacterium]
MIRFLQQDSKVTKILFTVIIGAAILAMVVYLVPGLLDNQGSSNAAVFATVREPGLRGRFFGESSEVKTQDVQRLAARQLQQQRLPDFLLPYMMNRAGQVLVQRSILKQEADRMHLQVSDEDLRQELQTGPFAQYLFPGGQYIGDDRYMDFVQTAFGTNRSDFESQLKQDMELNRLQALITGGVAVSDQAVREAYRKQGLKVKFDYAVISADELKKTINPPDAELEAFFKQNAAKYAHAIPETRKIQYVAFNASNLPGGKPQIADSEVQAYYTAHQVQYKTDEQVKTRHILIASKAGADAQADTAAKTKAEEVLKQVQSGGSFADLAKKYSDDPGSKDQGGELPMVPTAGLDPAYAKAAMALNPGQTSGLVKSQFGYHIIQTEAKQPAGTKPLAEVKDSITQVLAQQKLGQAQQQFAQQLAADAKKEGFDKAAASRGLKAVATDYLPKDGTVGGLSDSATLLGQAFSTDKNAAPATASTGDGFAVFQVVDVRPAHAPEFAAYKNQILADYRDQKVPAMLVAEAQRLDDRAKLLNDLRKAAAEFKVPVKSSDLVGQDGQVPDIGAMSGPAAVALTLPKGAISNAINTGPTAAVLTVTDRQEPTAEETTKNLEQTREQLLSKQREQIFRVYLGTLSEKYEKGGGLRYSKGAQNASTTPGDAPAGN